MVFGGASQFFERIKRRETLQDLWIFDVHQPAEKARWVQMRSPPATEKAGVVDADYEELDEDKLAEREIKRQFMHSAKFDKSSLFDQAQEIQDYGPPLPRMAHASGTFGGCLLIHGGYSGANDEILSDFAMFDIALGKWIRCKQPKRNRLEACIGHRYYHSMTVVQDPDIDFL